MIFRVNAQHYCCVHDFSLGYRRQSTPTVTQRLYWLPHSVNVNQCQYESHQPLRILYYIYSMPLLAGKQLSYHITTQKLTVGDELLPIELQRAYPAVVAIYLEQLFAAAHVPHRDRPVGGGGDQAVLVALNRTHRCGVALLGVGR